MKKMDFRKLNIFQKITLVFIGIAIVVGLFFANPLLFNGNSSLGAIAPDINMGAEIPIAIDISCVGDIMIHEPQLAAQYSNKLESYDFSNNFKYVKDYIKESDLALGNFEGTFGGEPFRGYPAFSSPDQLAEDLRNVGFDVIITANNHMVDRGYDGIIRTLDTIRGEGLATSGSRLNQNEKGYAIKNVKGVNIGVVAFTYSTKDADGNVAINGSYIGSKAEPLINSFAFETIDQDINKIRKEIESTKNAGADIVILYLHFGEEYQREPNKWQKSLVSRIIDEMPVDVIFASHPHVLQKLEMGYSSLSGRNVPIFYSMGNFISNQREETLQNHYTEQGMIAKVSIWYMRSENQIISLKTDAIPTWVDRYKRDGKTIYEIIPLDENLDNNQTLLESGHLNRARKALEEISELLRTD